MMIGIVSMCIRIMTPCHTAADCSHQNNSPDHLAVILQQANPFSGLYNACKAILWNTKNGYSAGKKVPNTSSTRDRVRLYSSLCAEIKQTENLICYNQPQPKQGRPT